MDERIVEEGPPSAGTTNLTVLNTTYLNGTQSYDDLYIGCGIVSCGSIVATGDLILSVNTLTVMNGASIIAYDQPTNTQGVGGSVQMSASYIGNGGGGAGHSNNGGGGGSSTSSGTATNGGSSFGVGNETGSNGGTVFDSSGNQVSAGGIGGGRIVIYADVIEIYGTVDASGQDGEQGYRYQNGSGTVVQEQVQDQAVASSCVPTNSLWVLQAEVRSSLKVEMVAMVLTAIVCQETLVLDSFMVDKAVAAEPVEPLTFVPTALQI